MNFDVTFQTSDTALDVDMQVGNKVAVPLVHDDHALLSNRDAADAHPMSAITGLEEALANAGSGGGGSSADVTAAIAEHNESGDAHADIRKAIEEKTVDLSGYAEKSELEGYLPLTGGTCTGDLTGTNITLNGTGSYKYGTINSYFNRASFLELINHTSYDHVLDGRVGMMQFQTKFEFDNPTGVYCFAKPGKVGWHLNTSKLNKGDYHVYVEAKSGTMALKEDFATVATSGSYKDLKDTPLLGDESSSGLTKLYAGAGTNTDGTMTQSAITEFVQTAIANALAGLDASGVSY